MRFSSRVFVGLLLLLSIVAVPVRGSCSPQDKSPSRARLQRIDGLMKRYGKQPFISMIRARRHGQISIEVNHKIRKAVGPPNKKYVTVRSVSHDMKLMGMSVETLQEALKPYLKERGGSGMKITSADAGPKQAGFTGDTAEAGHFTADTFGPADRDKALRLYREMIERAVEAQFPGERCYVDLGRSLKAEMRKDSMIHGYQVTLLNSGRTIVAYVTEEYLGPQGPNRIRSVRLDIDDPGIR